jgi:hypothetical protein
MASAKRHHLDVEEYLADMLQAITNSLALRDLMPERSVKSYPEQCSNFRRTEAAQAAQRRLSRRERRRQQGK